jgi:hypothetical protein
MLVEWRLAAYLSVGRVANLLLNVPFRSTSRRRFG